MLNNFDWEDVARIFIYVIFCFVLGCIVKSITAEGDTKSYYIEHYSGSPVKYYCVQADIDWRMDYHVHCTNNLSEALLLSFALNSKSPIIKESTPKLNTLQ